MLMEAKSMNMVVMYDALTFRNMSVDPYPNQNVLICDTAADQCTVTHKAWHIDAYSNRYIKCNNYLDANNSNNSHQCQLVSASIIIYGPNMNSVLVRVHEGVLMKD